MEWLRKYLIDAIAAAFLFALLVAVVVPWAIREPVISRDQSSPIGQNALQQYAAQPKKSDPISVAAVFGVRFAPPVSVTAPAPPRDETARWLTFLGYVAGENGTLKYFFKDSRTNEVLSLIPGRENDKGWKLVSIGEKSYVVRKNGTTYTVPR